MATPATRNAAEVTPSSRRYPTVEAHLTLGVLAKLGLFLVATIMLIAAIGRAQQLIGLVLIAGVLSATVAPLIERLRSRCGAVAGALVVHTFVFVIIVGMTVLVVQQIRSESEHLETYAAAQLAQLDEDVAPIAFSRADLSRRASDATASWGTVAVLGDDQATGIAVRASQLVVITVLSVFFSLQGNRIIDAVVMNTEDRERRRVARERWSDGVGAGAAQLRHTLLHGGIAGLVSVGVATVFGLPGVALLGFWAACVSAVPVVGPFVGWTPIVVVGALTLNSPPLGLLIGVAIAAVIILSRLRAMTSLAFTVGPLIITLGAAAGLNAAGLPGAAAGVFIATAFAHAVASHSWAIANFSAAIAVSESNTNAEPSSAERGALIPVPANDEPLAPTDSPTPDVYVDLSSETLLRIGGLIVLAVLVQLSIARIGTILVWAVVGLLIAVGIDRPVVWVQRRTGAPRSLVVIAGALIFAVVLIGLAVASSDGLASLGSIDDDLPRFAAALKGLPLVGSRLADLDVVRSIEDFRSQAPRLINRSPVAGQAVRVVSGGLVALFWIVATALTALIDGPRVASAVGRRVPARYIRQVTRLAGATRSALAGYVAGSALVAAINAALIGVLAVLSGVPMPAVLAIWAFSWNFVPQIGAIIGWTPLLVLALVVNPVVGAGCVAFFIVYQMVENNVIQPTIVGHAVDISALGALGAALTGTAIAGLVGAVLAIPIVGVVHAVRSEVKSEDFPRLRERLPSGAATQR